MNFSSLNLKILIGIIYFILFLIGFFLLFSFLSLDDLKSFEFIKIYKDIIFEYKNDNFFYTAFIFFIFSIVWILFLGFVFPLLILSGFIFGKWWGTIIVVSGVSIGATLLYILANFFLRNFIKNKLEHKFLRFKKFFIKNDFIYFLILRFLGGIPFTIQNILPVLFNMSVKKYFFATLLGCMPTMFISVAIGSGIEKSIEKNSKLDFFNALSSPEIYIPIICFISLLFLASLIRKSYFK